MRARNSLIAAALLTVCHAAVAEVYVEPAEALRLAFPSADEILEQRAILTDAKREQVAALIGKAMKPADVDRIYTFHIARSGGHFIGCAAIGDVPGKSQPITFMVAATRDSSGATLTLSRVEILVYRESHGWEVRREAWRDQFNGKGLSDSLRVGSDIRNISGATISCRSVTDGVRRHLAYLQIAHAQFASSSTRPPPPAVPLKTADPISPSPGPVLVSRSQLLMGTLLTVRCYAPDRERGQQAIDAAFTEVQRLDAMLSTYRPESDISRLNRSAGGDGLTISSELARLVTRALELNRETRAAFDITVTPLVQLWRAAAASGDMPADDAVQAALSLCGADVVELQDLRLRLRRAGAGLDFGAIGKGYALDCAAAALRAHGVECALLDFGGQFLALDAPPGEPGWQIEIRDPRTEGAQLATLRLVRASLSTSADDQQGLVIGDKKASHIVDPRSGMPARGMLSASVVASDATTADAYSTALLVLGSGSGLELAAQQGLAVLLLDDADQLTWTPQFAAMGASVTEAPK